MTRHGGWTQTVSGKRFYALDPRPEDVDILDIAHALSMQCRFGGHTREFFSVASHSLLVSTLVPDRLRLPALLHDAAEAYLIDLPRPIKRQPEFAHLRAIESAIEAAIATRFGLVHGDFHAPGVKHADLVALATEARDLMAVTPNPGEAWGEAAPIAARVVPQPPLAARGLFLDAFRAYGGTP